MTHLLATRQSRPLTKQEIEFVDAKWNEWYSSQIDVYGPKNASACFKLRRYRVVSNRRGKHISGGPDKLTPGWLGFLHEFKILPIGAGEMSHQCGCKLCINGLNVYHEPKNDNLGRRSCHKLIRKFEKAVRGTKNAVRGTVTVDLVGTLWQNQPAPACRHEPRCFVNFGCEREGKQMVYEKKGDV